MTHNNDTANIKRIRPIIFDRDEWTCRTCGFEDETQTGAGLHLDHVHPKKYGGTDDVENLQTLCAKCNQTKGAKTAGDRIDWFNPRWQQYWPK